MKIMFISNFYAKKLIFIFIRDITPMLQTPINQQEPYVPGQPPPPSWMSGSSSSLAASMRGLYTSGQLFVYFRFNRKSAVSLNFCQLFVYIFFRWNDRSIWISKSSFHSTWSIWRITKTRSPSLFQYFSIKSYWRRWRNLSCLNFSSRKIFMKSFSRKVFPQIDFTEKYFKYEAILEEYYEIMVFFCKIVLENKWICTSLIKFCILYT